MRNAKIYKIKEQNKTSRKIMPKIKQKTHNFPKKNIIFPFTGKKNLT